MFETLKKVNNALRLVFIGFTLIIAIIKVFELDSRKKPVINENAEQVTSEFDEIW